MPGNKPSARRQVKTPYNFCHVYLQYLDHDHDIGKLELPMPHKDAVEARAFGPDVKNMGREARRMIRVTPPTLVDNMRGGVAVIGQPHAKSVAPRVMAIAIVMPRICLHCTVIAHDHVRPEGYKRCGRSRRLDELMRLA
jgi:hypothetical protein